MPDETEAGAETWGELPAPMAVIPPPQSTIRAPGGGKGRALAVIAVSGAALAMGALAIGALAIGAVAIGRLAVGRARIKTLEIDELIIHGVRGG